MRISIDGADPAAGLLIQAQLDAHKARGTRSQLLEVEVEGDLFLRQGLVLDPYCSVLDFGGATVRYTGAAGACITQLSTVANAFTQLIGGVQHVNLVGNANPNTTGMDLRGASAETRTATAQHGVTISKFGVGLRLSEFAYLNHFYGLVIDGCTTQLLFDVGADAGENVSIHGGAISNGGLALDIRSTTAELSLHSVSIDYNQQMARIAGGGVVTMHGGHLEHCSTCPAGQIEVLGNGGSFLMIGGRFLLAERGTGGINGGAAGPYGFSHLINVGHENASVEFARTRLHNLRNLSDTIAIGPGRVVIDAQTLNQALMPRRAHASQLLPILGLQGFVFQEQSPNTLTVGNGAGRVQMTRGQVGTGFVQVGGLSMQVGHLRGRRLSLAALLEGNLGANSGVSLHWADGPTPATWTRRDQITLNAFVGVVSAPITVGLSSDLRVPAWATHLVVSCDITGSTAGKWFALTPVELGGW